MVKCGLKDKICVYINVDNIIGTKYIGLYYKCFASKKLCLNVNVSNRVLYTFYGQSPYSNMHTYVYSSFHISPFINNNVIF